MPSTPPLLMPTAYFDGDDPAWHTLDDDPPPPPSPDPPQKPDEQQQGTGETTSPLDVDAINHKVNELVQALVDAMQQTTEYICQAEEVTRSMVDGLQGYRESINKRGDQLEQTWQQMRLYARNIAGHRTPGAHEQSAD